MKINKLILTWMAVTFCGGLFGQNAVENHVLRYCTDEINTGIGMGSSAIREIGGAICLDQAKLANYKGEKITALNIGLNQMPGDTCTIFATKDLNGAYLWTQNIEKPNTGWNYVKLKHPIDIDGTPIYIGVVTRTGCLSLGLSSGDKNTNADWMYYRAKSTDKITWRHASDVHADKWVGALTIEALITGSAVSGADDYKQYATFGYFTNHKVLIDGEAITLKGSIQNKGYLPLNSADVIVFVDDETQPRTYALKNLNLGNRETYYFSLPTEIKFSEGLHNIKVNMGNFNGAGGEPTSAALTSLRFNAQNDCFYPSLFVEDFSTAQCVNCPGSMNYVREVIANHDDISLVTHHSGYGTDEFTIPTSSYLATYLGVPGSPFLVCNRATINQTAQVVNQTGIITYAINEQLIKPAYVKVEQNVTYDSKTRLATITVTATKKAGWTDGDLKLSLYISEDVRTVKPQSGAGSYYMAFESMRDVITKQGDTDTGGEDVVWNGDTFTKTYTYTLPESWNAEKITFVSFLAKGLQGNSLDVYASTNKKLSEVISTGVESHAVADTRTIRVASGKYVTCAGTKNATYFVYTVEGALVEQGVITESAQLGNLQRGLYLIRIGNNVQKFIK